MLAFELDGRTIDLPPARRQLARHRVERLDERAELVVALWLDPLIEPARANFARRSGQQLHRSSNALRQIESRPRRAHEDEQGHHQEEGQIHTR